MQVVQDDMLFHRTLSALHLRLGTTYAVPILPGITIHLRLLYHAVTQHGGIRRVCALRLWPLVCSMLQYASPRPDLYHILQRLYTEALFQYEQLYYHGRSGPVQPPPVTVTYVPRLHSPATSASVQSAATVDGGADGNRVRAKARPKSVLARTQPPPLALPAHSSLSSGLSSGFSSGTPSDLFGGLQSNLSGDLFSDLFSDLPNELPSGGPSGVPSGLPSGLPPRAQPARAKRGSNSVQSREEQGGGGHTKRRRTTGPASAAEPTAPRSALQMFSFCCSAADKEAVSGTNKAHQGRRLDGGR